MSLSEIMAQAGLAVYAEIALVLFLILFLGILVHTFRRRNRARFERARRMPLEDAPTVTKGASHHE